MAKDRPIPMAFGDVKPGGRITARTSIGDVITLVKITPIFATGVQNTQEFVLSGAIDSPVCYNTIHFGKEGKASCFFLLNDALVTFFTDF